MASDHPDSAACALDHFVLPVTDLVTARARLPSLGFTVAPDGLHPFGTANCCVYFGDGTYLEPLAVADGDRAEAATKDGNVFTARDATYRTNIGENGFSAIVVRSQDAAADHARFAAAGVSAGQILDFSRPFTDANGRQDTGSFRLAFAADPDAPDVFFFAVQRLNTLNVDRQALEAHANGVRRVVRVLFAAERPAAHAGIFAEVVGGPAGQVSDREFDIAAANATLAILTPAALQADFGIAAVASPLRAVGLVFATDDLAATETLLRGGGIEFERRGDRLVVRPAPGQGATFIFEASR